MVASLGDSGGLAGQHRSSSRLGIHRVGLTPPTTGLAIWPIDLHHDLVVGGQEASQTSTVAAGAFHPEHLDLTQTLGPVQQLPIAPGLGGNPGGGQVAAQLVQGAGDMHLAMGVDADRDPARPGVCDGGDGRLPS